MANSVEKRTDGSIALLINGDLQFDSNDERIYHEALVLPGLAIAEARNVQPLKALVIGGGDGLVARELFKSNKIDTVDLVDIDPEIVDLARSEFAHINAASMSDARLNVHIGDAWDFVHDSAMSGKTFNYIVSDLTVAEDAAGARFHSIEWYQALKRLLGENGVLAVNGVSPQATPEAFWSVFNSMLTAGVHARAYAINIPSFQERGYGKDWGFFLCGTSKIEASELEQAKLAEPRMALLDMAQARNYFVLPEALFSFQENAAPAHVGSEILLHYFRNSNPLKRTYSALRDSFDLDTQALVVPPADTGDNIFPPELRAALAECLYTSQTEEDPTGQSAIVSRVLQLMPALQQFHTPEIIADFVDRPAAFLQSIDIAGLVERLLQRAAELPAQLVEELRHLSEKLSEWAGDYVSLVQLGERVVTVLTLVVVVGNLMYPDAVYAKGDHHHDHGDHLSAGDRRGLDAGNRRADRGFDANRRAAWAADGRSWGGYHGYWGHHWGSYGWARPWHGYYWGGYVPPVYVGANNWPNVVVRNNEYVDETGTSYPARSYNYSGVTNYGTANGGGYFNADSNNSTSAPNGTQAASYRLADGADILPSGNVSIPLTSQAYLMVTPQGTQVVDQSTGQSVVALANDPALIYHAAVEMKRQHHRLTREIEKAQNGSGDNGQSISSDKIALMQQHADLLKKALANLGPIPQNAPSAEEATPPVAKGIELFASVWMTPDGKFLAIKRANGKIAYLNGNGWYSDLGHTKLHTPYPEKLKTIATGFLNQMVSDADRSKEMLQEDQKEGQRHLDALARELADYQGSAGEEEQGSAATTASTLAPTDMVDYGTRKIKRSEAIRLTKLAIARTQNKLDELQKQIDAMPQELQVAQEELANLNA